MKKAILTIGLFSLVMVLTSFTTTETKNNVQVGSNTFLTGGQAVGGNQKVDLTGGQAVGGNQKVDLTGGQAVGGNQKVDLTGGQAVGGNQKVD
jgi:general stress protein YciG